MEELMSRRYLSRYLNKVLNEGVDCCILTIDKYKSLKNEIKSLKNEIKYLKHKIDNMELIF